MSKFPFKIADILAMKPEKKKQMVRVWKDKCRQQTGAGKKGNRTNITLDPEDFNGPNWTCLSAASAATGQYRGFGSPLTPMNCQVQN